MNISRFLQLGGSICRVLRGSEALGGSICYVLRRSEALGCSICYVLRVGEALGVNGVVRPGVSAKEHPSRVWGVGEGEGGEARFLVFRQDLTLGEVRFVVFCVSGELSGLTE